MQIQPTPVYIISPRHSHILGGNSQTAKNSCERLLKDLEVFRDV